MGKQENNNKKHVLSIPLINKETQFIAQEEMRTQSHKTRRNSRCGSSAYNEGDDGNVTDVRVTGEGTLTPPRNTAMQRRKLYRRYQEDRRRASNDGQLSRASISSSRRRESSSISLSISLVSSNDSHSFMFNSERS